MSLKSFGLFTLSIFALVLVTGLTSAASNISNGGVFILSNANVPDPVLQNTGTFTITFNINNTGATQNVDFSNSTISNGTFGTFSPASGSSLTAGSTTAVSVPVIFSTAFSGVITGNIVVEPSSVSSASNLSFSVTVNPTTLPPEVSSCTSVGNPGQLRVKGIDFNNRGMQYNTFGEDDEWFPFEEIEAEIEVENSGNDDVDDISVEWGIWDTDKNQWVIDLDEEDEINLKDGDEETLTLTFKIDDDMDVDLDELADGNNYRFYVVATGTVDNSTSPETCASDFEQTSIIIESDFVVLDNFDVPETVQCGETVTITADAWNIGDNDQDEVSVRITNKEFGLEEDFSAGDIDAFDRQQVPVTFTVPSDAEEKTYRLNFQVYDEDNDLYENDFDDDKSEFMIPLQVSGSCGAAGEEEVSVVANIASGGREGQELVVKATVTNTGNTQQTYALNVAGFEDWASSSSLDKNSLTLGAGQSGDVSVTLDVNDGAAGSRTFFLELVSGGELTRQPVTVSISERAAGITGLITEGNWYLWGIGLLNIILVIVIIVVAVRIARK